MAMQTAPHNLHRVNLDDYKKMANFIVALLQLCTETESESPCYWTDNKGQQCNMDTTIRYHSGKKKYCRNVTETKQCPLGDGQCQLECNNAPKKPGVCSVTCGEGNQPLEITDTSKYFKYCPPVSQRCKGPPCPGTATPTTTTPKKTKTSTATTSPTKTTSTGTGTGTTTRTTRTSTAPTEEKFQFALWQIGLIVLAAVYWQRSPSASSCTLCINDEDDTTPHHHHRTTVVEAPALDDAQAHPHQRMDAHVCTVIAAMDPHHALLLRPVEDPAPVQDHPQRRRSMEGDATEIALGTVEKKKCEM